MDHISHSIFFFFLHQLLSFTWPPPVPPHLYISTSYSVPQAQRPLRLIVNHLSLSLFLSLSLSFSDLIIYLHLYIPLQRTFKKVTQCKKLKGKLFLERFRFPYWSVRTFEELTNTHLTCILNLFWRPKLEDFVVTYYRATEIPLNLRQTRARSDAFELKNLFNKNYILL